MAEHGFSKSDSGEQGKNDIGSLLKAWTFEPGAVKVRKIMGEDGRVKLQMREPLGIVQMELTGRPDGERPEGCESLLDYYEGQLDEHVKLNGNELGFHLTRPQCEALRHEAAMYLQRYQSLAVLEEFAGVARDTARNLRVLELCGRYAVDEQDRIWMEQYRPYIVMMNTRAVASLLLQEGKTEEALKTVKRSLRAIREFFRRFDQEEAYAHANEVKVLKRFRREIQAKLPQDPLAELQRQLAKAIKAERYEEAARLRDEIAKTGKA